MPEHRFVLSDFTRPAPGGFRLYEAGRSYPMPPALAHVAAKRDLRAPQATPLDGAEHPDAAGAGKLQCEPGH
jgi:hypothetical protein